MATINEKIKSMSDEEKADAVKSLENDPWLVELQEHGRVCAVKLLESLHDIVDEELPNGSAKMKIALAYATGTFLQMAMEQSVKMLCDKLEAPANL